MFVSKRSKRWRITLGALLTLGLLSITPAQAADPADPVGVKSTLEGCRKPAGLTFPDNGPYICPDQVDGKDVYTSGNLGKTWNELDLVPYRITLQAGNSAPARLTPLAWLWTMRMQTIPDMTSFRPRC